MGVFEYVITEMGKILKSFPICQIGVLEYINILWFIHIPGLPDGDYADIVYKQTFSVENGVLKGIMQPETSYIIVKK